MSTARITCDMCALSLLESREQRYIKAMNNNNKEVGDRLILTSRRGLMQTDTDFTKRLMWTDTDFTKTMVTDILIAQRVWI